MTLRAGLQIVRFRLWLGLAFFCCVATLSAQTNSNDGSSNPRNNPDAAAYSQDTLRSYLQIQDQLHNTDLAIEKNRQEVEAAAARNAEALEVRLKLLETTMNSQRRDELKEMQHSNHVVLIAAGTFIVIAFVVLLFSAFLQWSAVNRLAAATTSITSTRALAGGQPNPMLGMGEVQILSNGSAEHSPAHFLEVLDRLEKRISEMETSLHPAKTLPEILPINQPIPNNNLKSSGHIAQSNGTAPLSHVSDQTAEIAVLLSKGHTLLKLDQVEEALACYDEVLSLDARNTEALVKKGTVLERLQKLDEAIACYDQALETDGNMTMAYLYKGGVYNRLERYTEALECYEKALQTQEKSHAA
ncbi:tetratricopeptide repeat protein [Pedosphaera parvula]|uniref:TPR repeat-containing protein n=1 Tax=Pedosphaera parvula (strain Ellin514) TaxID=320771 RepID=B9XF31_PEDPL|nr:tetratricopeptide repeat protein [Pedosphaera parvula]EEF61529.1 TPR repeat-containing protein [Pedosphaera parvula Ellin514]